MNYIYDDELSGYMGMRQSLLVPSLLLSTIPYLVLDLIKGEDVSMGNLVAATVYGMLALYNLDNVSICSKIIYISYH